MISKVIILPELVSLPLQSEQENTLTYNAVLVILRELATNCLIYIHNYDYVNNYLFETISQWPIKYRTPGLQYLRKLRERNRFVIPRNHYSSSEYCGNDYCKNLIGIAKSQSETHVITCGNCLKCSSSQIREQQIVNSNDYVVSDFFTGQESKKEFAIKDGEWTQREFAERILAPIFSHAKHVKLIDRMIGNSMKDNGLRIGMHYKATIEWIVQLFLENSIPSASRYFDIYTNLRQLSAKQESYAKSDLISFTKEVREKYTFPKFNINFRDNLPHARYLLTDQISVMIERGFDLLKIDPNYPDKRPCRIRDVTVTCCSNSPSF